MKRFCVVTILFILIVSAFIVPSFADDIEYVDFSNYQLPYIGNRTILSSADYREAFYSGSLGIFTYLDNNKQFELLYGTYDTNTINRSNIYFFRTDTNWYLVSDYRTGLSYCPYNVTDESYGGLTSSQLQNNKQTINGVNYYYNQMTYYSDYSYMYMPVFASRSEGIQALDYYLNNDPPIPTPTYTKNANVDEFIANTLISMGVKFNSYTSALPVSQSAWNYLIDENNWYIGSGDRTDKDIKWDIDSAVSYLNAQSNNYMDWYNGYKVSKDVTVALTKFIKDNYVSATLGQGTLAGENVSLNTQYMYSSSGGSGTNSSFGSQPSAFSFYPASTVTYFNGQYLHDNNEIDLDEFIYTPADVRKFISYPSSAGLIEPPEDSSGTGVITDGNGDTVYNIDLDFPSLDWLADAIQAVLDFLNRLITTIADFLTQILDAILSLFSDAFESLTTFGQGIIEWLYSVIESLGTLGSNYIPSDLWAIILPFIYLNVGIAILMFVLRSH